MQIETWVAFLIASTVVLSVPGPTVMLVVSYALGQGRSSGWATVPGVALGDFTAMTASLLGAGAVLAASATLFTVLKLVGAVYLIWLGYKLWTTQHVLSDLSDTSRSRSNSGMFWNAFVVTALNPKSIVFFVAFVPQFVDTNAPALPQFIILEATFVILATINVIIWAVLAGRLRTRFKNPATLKFINRLGASFLIGAGLLTALARR